MTDVDADFESAVREEVVRLMRRPPKLTAPGLLGTRLEHLSATSEDKEAAKLQAEIVTWIAFGQMPLEVMQALKNGEVMALQKSEHDVRPLLMGSVLRRLGL